jgi:hypothetical protein
MDKYFYATIVACVLVISVASCEIVRIVYHGGPTVEVEVERARE